MPTTIKLKNSVTTTNAPSSLVQGEVAINITDKKVWVGNAATTPIQLLGAGASMSFSALTCTSLTNSGLTSGRVTYATTAGLLTDSANLTFNGTTLTANTIGAFTLGGTIAGGGNQINNIVIGASTPLAGSFTTLSASGVATFSAGTVSAPAITTTGDTNTGIFFPAADTIAFAEGGAEAMRIDSAGNVGIGMTPSGDSRLEVYSADSATIYKNVNTGTGTSDGFYVGMGKSSATEAYVYNRENNNLIFGTNNTERMRIDSSGNVGIGTSSPNGPLDVNATIPRVVLSTSGTVRGQINIAGSAMNLTVNETTFPMTFNTGGGERMRITSGGLVLIGKSASSDSTVGIELQPNGYATATTTSSANTFTTWNVYSTGAGAYRFYVGAGGTVYATSTTITGISDQRVKENIVDLPEGIDAVMALKPRKFDWKKGKGKNIKGDRGFIAQEFEIVFPDMIEEWKDQAPKGEEPYKAVNANLIPVLVKAIQELKAELDATKAEVALLKSK